MKGVRGECKRWMESKEEEVRGGGGERARAPIKPSSQPLSLQPLSLAPTLTAADAHVRLRATPPAFRDSRKTVTDGSVVNASIAAARAGRPMPPSRRTTR